MQKRAEEVYRARTTPQPEQHTNNAISKHKKQQAPSTKLCTVNRTQQQTNTTAHTYSLIAVLSTTENKLVANTIL